MRVCAGCFFFLLTLLKSKKKLQKTKLKKKKKDLYGESAFGMHLNLLLRLTFYQTCVCFSQLFALSTFQLLLPWSRLFPEISVADGSDSINAKVRDIAPNVDFLRLISCSLSSIHLTGSPSTYSLIHPIHNPSELISLLLTVYLSSTLQPPVLFNKHDLLV